MIIEAFNIYDGDGDKIKWWVIFLIVFYIVATLFVAYRFPINFSRLLNIILSSKFRLDESINYAINFILAIFFSMIFWIIKIVELLIYNIMIRENKKHKKVLRKRAKKYKSTKIYKDKGKKIIKSTETDYYSPIY